MGLIGARSYNFKVPYHNLQRENSRGDTIEVILHIFYYGFTNTVLKSYYAKVLIIMNRMR